MFRYGSIGVDSYCLVLLVLKPIGRITLLEFVKLLLGNLLKALPHEVVLYLLVLLVSLHHTPRYGRVVKVVAQDIIREIYLLLGPLGPTSLGQQMAIDG